MLDLRSKVQGFDSTRQMTDKRWDRWICVSLCRTFILSRFVQGWTLNYKKIKLSAQGRASENYLIVKTSTSLASCLLSGLANVWIVGNVHSRLKHKIRPASAWYQLYVFHQIKNKLFKHSYSNERTTLSSWLSQNVILMIVRQGSRQCSPSFSIIPHTSLLSWSMQ